MQGRRPSTSNRSDIKALLTTVKLTTTIGTVSLTLAGWGLLARVDATNAAANQPSPAPAIGAALSAVSPTPTAAPPTPSPTPSPVARVAPRRDAVQKPGPQAVGGQSGVAAPAPTATSAPTATPASTATPAVKFKLDIVQWVQTRAGDPVAVVRDNRGILWFVWGSDVPRIEQGLAPTVQPQPVNGFGRSRGS